MSLIAANALGTVANVHEAVLVVHEAPSLVVTEELFDSRAAAACLSSSRALC
jgi:hypothetical protein